MAKNDTDYRILWGLWAWEGEQYLSPSHHTGVGEEMWILSLIKVNSALISHEGVGLLAGVGECFGVVVK